MKKTNKEILVKTFEERAKNAKAVCEFAAMMNVPWQEALNTLTEEN